ncbi:MAG: T-protein [Chlamydiia bacterium]|nr:T-protein [Chlamydiia bacterium]MCH9615629.1 T-protein [Chlamydiia bacterium]MCH9628968.1 T-protein [Chlamydiia bacterium]
MKTFGIIGGEGKMGQWLKARLPGEVMLSSNREDNLELAKKCDVVCISVPISVTVKVIEEIAPVMREEQLLFDLTSVKEKPCAAMAKAKCHVIGVHPMFGPRVEDLEGQNVAYCPIRPGNFVDLLEDVFEGAKLIEISPEKHDRMMAMIQSMTHFSSLAFVGTMMREGLNVDELFEFATPVFRMQLMIAARVLSQSSELYADIKMENPYFDEVADTFEGAVEQLRGLVDDRDRAAYGEYFEKLGDFLGAAKDKGNLVTQSFVEML